MTATALVVGASGIVGSATDAFLVERGWAVQGLARYPVRQGRVPPVAAGLRDAEASRDAFDDLHRDAVLITTRLRQDARPTISGSTPPWCATC